MSTIVFLSIPTSLQKFTDYKKNLELKAETIQELIEVLISIYPILNDHLLDETNTVRRFINIYINSEDIKFLENTQTKLKDGDKITILTAVAGG